MYKALELLQECILVLCIGVWMQSRIMLRICIQRVRLRRREKDGRGNSKAGQFLFIYMHISSGPESPGLQVRKHIEEIWKVMRTLEEPEARAAAKYG